jgi:hypothetical protein
MAALEAAIQGGISDEFFWMAGSSPAMEDVWC